MAKSTAKYLAHIAKAKKLQPAAHRSWHALGEKQLKDTEQNIERVHEKYGGQGNEPYASEAYVAAWEDALEDLLVSEGCWGFGGEVGLVVVK